MYVYLAKFGSASRKISVEEKSQAALVSAMKEQGIDMGDCSEISVQSWDEDFSDYVDVLDFNSLPDKTKINFVKVSAPSSAPQAVVSCTVNIPQQNNTENDESQHGTVGFRPFPVVYQLPKFPFTVASVLATKPGEVLLNASYRNQIIHTLYEDMVKYENGYPSSRAYNLVLSRLIQTHPELSDKRLSANVGRCNVSPYATWKQSLVNKFKYQRGKLSSGEEIDSMRAKYGRKNTQKPRNPIEPPSDSEAGSYQRHPHRELLKLPSNIGIGEDKGSIEAHLSVLNKEWEKATPDMALIQDRMKRTAVHRLELYNGPVEPLLTCYRPLADSHQLLADNQLYHGWKFAEARKNLLTNEKVDKMLQLIGRKKASKLYSIPGMDADLELKQQTVIGLLPLLFREPMSWWLCINKDVKCKEPIIQVVNTENDKTFISEGSSYKVFLDATVVCGNAPSLDNAVDTLFSVIYLFNTSFPKALGNTCRFVSEVLYNIPCKNKLPNTVQKLVNNLCVDSICDCGLDDCTC